MIRCKIQYPANETRPLPRSNAQGGQFFLLVSVILVDIVLLIEHFGLLSFPFKIKINLIFLASSFDGRLLMEMAEKSCILGVHLIFLFII